MHNRQSKPVKGKVILSEYCLDDFNGIDNFKRAAAGENYRV